MATFGFLDLVPDSTEWHQVFPPSNTMREPERMVASILIDWLKAQKCYQDGFYTRFKWEGPQIMKQMKDLGFEIWSSTTSVEVDQDEWCNSSGTSWDASFQVTRYAWYHIPSQTCLWWVVINLGGGILAWSSEEHHRFITTNEEMRGLEDEFSHYFSAFESSHLPEVPWVLDDEVTPVGSDPELDRHRVDQLTQLMEAMNSLPSDLKMSPDAWARWICADTYSWDPQEVLDWAPPAGQLACQLGFCFECQTFDCDCPSFCRKCHLRTEDCDCEEDPEEAPLAGAGEGPPPRAESSPVALPVDELRDID